MSAAYAVVVSTTDSEAAAHVLAAQAVEVRLGACAQVVPITSVFRWEGEVRTEHEWRVEIKTTADRVDALVEQIKANHGYDVPEVVVTPIIGGSGEYLSWLADEAR